MRPDKEHFILSCSTCYQKMSADGCAVDATQLVVLGSLCGSRHMTVALLRSCRLIPDVEHAGYLGCIWDTSASVSSQAAADFPLVWELIKPVRELVERELDKNACCTWQRTNLGFKQNDSS